MTNPTAQITRRANHPTLKAGDSIVISKGAHWSQGLQPVAQAQEGPVVAKAGGTTTPAGSVIYVDSDGDILVHFDDGSQSVYCGAEYVTADTGDVSDPDYAIDTAVCTTDGGQVWRISLTADRLWVRIKDQLKSDDPLMVGLDAPMPAILTPLFHFTDKDSTSDIRSRVEAIKHAVGFMAARDSHMAAARIAKDEHSTDIDIISDMLNEEATGRGWCEEYDTFVEHINEHLKVPMTLREKEWKVSGRVRVETWVEVETTITQAGEPSSGDIEMVLRDLVDEDMVRTAIESDFDVEEVSDTDVEAN